MAESGLIEVAALGRPFTLGMLYDARKDQLIPGFTLWDEKSLEENMLMHNQHSSNFKINTSDSLEEKSSLLDVGASLKASFLGGLVELGASANYLTDRKTSHNQSRVTFHYKATTTFKQLNISPDEKKLIKIDDDVKSLATHVVTGILYGAHAFLVCDSERLDRSSLQKIEASMQAVINMVGGHVKGEVSMKLSKEQKDVTERFRCKFYGDLVPVSNPVTFEEAVKTYKDLGDLLGEDKKNSVPLKVWMMPLKVFDQAAPEKKSNLSTGLIRKAQDALEDLHELKMRCDDCLDSDSFPQIHEMLSRFKNLCNNYKQKLQDLIANKIPSIRAGNEDERELLKVLDNREKTPFSSQMLEKWMSNMETQVSVIRSCEKEMEGAKIAPKKLDVDEEVNDPVVEDVLCFVFTSLKSTDLYLQKMSDYLDKGDLGASEDVMFPSTENEWYLSNEASLRAKAAEFGDLARGLKKASRFRCLVTAISNEKYKGATIYHYSKNKLVTEDFSKPDVPDVEKVTSRRDLMWYATDLTLDPKTANPKLILSEENKRATHGDQQSYPDDPERFDCYHQVLCKEALTGRHYWEVEWSLGYDKGVSVGVTYSRIVRKGAKNLSLLGQNNMSWIFGHRWSPNRAHYAEHKDKCELYEEKPSTFNKLGVYVDWPAGILSFYKVLGENLSHLFTFREKFSEPLYPAFNIMGKKNMVFINVT